MGSPLLPISAAHGGGYRGDEKENFLRVGLRYREYHDVLWVIFLGGQRVGLGKPTPHRLRG